MITRSRILDDVSANCLYLSIWILMMLIWLVLYSASFFVGIIPDSLDLDELFLLARNKLVQIHGPTRKTNLVLDFKFAQ